MSVEVTRLPSGLVVVTDAMPHLHTVSLGVWVGCGSRDERADEQETAATIRTVRREAGYLMDPHTAVGIAVAEKETRDPSVPMIVLGTAHAAKFPDAVEAACGVRPQLPEWLADLNRRPERMTAMPVDQRAVESHILSTSRAAREGVVA